MIEKCFKNPLFFILSAIIMNGLILMMIAHLSEHQNHQTSRKNFFDAIFLTKYEPLPPPPPVRKKLIQPKKEKPKTIPKKITFKQKRPRVNRPRVNFKMPKVNFQINPALKTGMAIAPPPPEPVIRQPEPMPVVSEPEPVVEQAEPTPIVQSVPSEFGMDEVDQKPSILQKVEPTYPYRARRRNIKGMVTVKFLVSAAGHVTRPSIIEARPSGIFEQSVLQAIRKWRFKPGYYQGKPVATWVVLPIQFNLSG